MKAVRSLFIPKDVRPKAQIEQSPAAVTASSTPLVRSTSMTRLSDLPTAARNNLIREVCILLQDRRTKIDGVTPDGYTALHWAARNGHQEVVAILLAHKANPTITTPEGETAVQLAEEKKHDAIVSLLIKYQQEYQIGPEASVELLSAEPSALSMLQALAGGNFDYKDVLSPAELARARKDKNHINLRDAHGATELHKAVQAQRADLVRDLLQRRAHIDARDFKDQTPLIVALSQDSVELVELLIASGANIEASHPLHWTVKHNRIALAKVLLRCGADLQARAITFGGRDECPLEYVSGYNRRNKNGLGTMEQFLVDQGADYSAPKKVYVCSHFEHGQGIVRKAVMEHHKDTVKKVLQYAGTAKEEIELRDEYGQTPLLLAAECCLDGVARTLIAFKADVAAQDDEGGTALHYAASEGNQTKLIDALIEVEADVNARNKHGETALHLWAQKKVVDDKKVAKERLRIAELLIAKADLSLVDEQGRTALHYAVEANNLPLVKLLVKNTPSVPDGNGQTPLLLATSLGHSKIAKLLGKKK